MAEGVRLAHRAADTGSNDSEALWMAAQTLAMLAGEFERALPLIDKSLSLNSNSPGALQASGLIRALYGDGDIALEHAARAMRHSSRDPLANQYLITLTYVNFWAGRYQEADRLADEVLGKEPAFAPGVRLKVATCGLLGRTEEGREWVRRVLAIMPRLSIRSQFDFYAGPLRYNARGLESIIRGLRLSGLPEG